MQICNLGEFGADSSDTSALASHTFLLTLFVFLGAIVLFGADRTWRAVMRVFKFFVRQSPEKAHRFVKRMDRVALGWDGFLDRFPEGSVDGLYLPDFQSIQDVEKLVDEIPEISLDAVKVGRTSSTFHKDIWDGRDKILADAIDKRRVLTDNKYPQHEPDQSTTSIQNPSSKSWCYAGTDRNFRSCVQVKNSTECMSGKIYSSKRKFRRKFRKNKNY